MTKVIKKGKRERKDLRNSKCDKGREKESQGELIKQRN